MLSTHKTLGLAVTEHALRAVEVEASAGRRIVHGSVELPLSGGLSLAEPEALGKALRQALRGAGISASRCIVGLAAGYIAAREKLLPPANDEALKGVISLAVEREYASGASELVFDYLHFPTSKGVCAMVAAAPRTLVDRISAMCKAAGLSLAGITSSTVVLASATAGDVGPSGRIILTAQARGVELAMQSAGGVRLMRHIPAKLASSHDPAAAPSPVGQVDMLCGELRRALSMAAPDPSAAQEPQVLLWDCVGLDAKVVEAISAKMAHPLKVCRLDGDLGVACSQSGDARFAQAIAVGSSGQTPLLLDFLHSRLAAASMPRFSRQTIYAAIAAAVVLVGAALLYFDYRGDQQEIAELRLKQETMKSPAAQAKQLVDDLKYARTWFDRRPAYLDVWAEIVTAFPPEGSKAYATGLSIHEDMQVLLTGKAASREAALEVIDHLSTNPRLADIKPQYIRSNGGTAKDVSFACSLVLRRTN